MSTSEDIAKLYQSGVVAINSREMQLESFGFFLEEYVIQGGAVTTYANVPRRFTITEAIISFDESLYRVYEKTVNLNTGGTYFVDFTTKAGFVVNTVHPTDPYRPLWQINTDAHGNILSTVDLRGPMGFVRFRSEIQGVIASNIIVDESHITANAVGTSKLQNSAVTEPKMADDSVSPRVIQDDAIRAFHVMNGAIVYEKLGSDVIALLNALQTGDSGPAANAARVSTPKGITFATLKDRVDDTDKDVIALQADFADLVGSKKLKLFGCVLYNDAGTWKAMTLNQHTPLGLASVSQVGSVIRITYDFTAINVISLVCTPDEVYAERGYQFGASVGVSFSDITCTQLSKTIGGYVLYTGTEWVVSYGSGNLAVSSYANGVLTLSHDGASGSTMGSVTPYDNDVNPVFGALGDTTTEIKFYDNKLYNKTIGGYFSYDGANWHITYADGNWAVVGYSAGTLTLSHDDVGNDQIMGSANMNGGGYVVSLGSLGATTTEIQFYDYAGTLITTPTTGMKGYITRTSKNSVGSLLTTPTIGMKCFVSRSVPSRVIVPANLIEPGANIWVMGIMEI